jgi:pyruvate/2-oxoacid:ferredoxin oxidoreductase beta subunit
LKNYLYNETRFTVLVQNHPAVAEQLLLEAEKEVAERWKRYEQLAAEWTPTEGQGAAS